MKRVFSGASRDSSGGVEHVQDVYMLETGPDKFDGCKSNARVADF